MSTQAQIEANRQNAHLSTGPLTETGKEASSQNAKTHGIFARIVPEEETGFHELLDSLLETYRPNPGMEQTLVEQVALSYFRLQRLYAYEQSACTLRDSARHDLEEMNEECMEHGVELPVMGILTVLAHEAAKVATFKGYAESPANRLLVRYEAMLNRQIQRNLEMLDKIQLARKNRELADRKGIDEERRRVVKRKLGSDGYFQAFWVDDLTLDEMEERVAQLEAPPQSSAKNGAARPALAARAKVSNGRRHPTEVLHSSGKTAKLAVPLSAAGSGRKT